MVHNKLTRDKNTIKVSFSSYARSICSTITNYALIESLSSEPSLAFHHHYTSFIYIRSYLLPLAISFTFNASSLLDSPFITHFSAIFHSSPLLSIFLTKAELFVNVIYRICSILSQLFLQFTFFCIVEILLINPSFVDIHILISSGCKPTLSYSFTPN